MSSILGALHSLGGWLLGLLGGWDATLKLLLAMMGMDYLSGILVGCMGRSTRSAAGCISSKASFNGLMKKGLILMVVTVAAQVDLSMEGAIARGATAWFYIINEAISILENAAIAGIPLPKKLLSMLDVAKTAEEPPHHPPMAG